MPPEQAFAPIRRLGGRQGWYFADWVWRVRAFADLLVGGVGMRRGRRDPDELSVGDTLDCWRVEAYEPDRLLRLRAETRLPGRAWLEFEVVRTPRGARLCQTSEFDPVGAFGTAYRWVTYPVHRLMFAGLLREIARAAESSGKGGGAGATGTDRAGETTQCGTRR